MNAAQRPGYTVAPVVQTWEATVYQVTGSRVAYLVVPRTSAAGFDQALASGQIDATITGYLAEPDRGRVLDRHALMLTLGLYDRLGDPQQLTAPERDPRTGIPRPAASREDKNRDQRSPEPDGRSEPHAPPARAIKWPVLAAVGVALVVVAGVGIAVASGGGGTPNDGAASDKIDSSTSNADVAPLPGDQGAPGDTQVGESRRSQYRGTLVRKVTSGGGNRDPSTVTLDCTDSTCTIVAGMAWVGTTELTVAGDRLVGSSTSEACGPGSGSAVETVTVEFADQGTTMRLRAVRPEIRTEACGSYGQTVTFTGRLVEGEAAIPGA